MRIKPPSFKSSRALPPLLRRFIMTLGLASLITWFIFMGHTPTTTTKTKMTTTTTKTKTTTKKLQPINTPPRLLSKDATVTADVRGNLGPPSVMLKGGTDWLKDRWQAGADMHGTPLKGPHWVLLEFPRPVQQISSIVLDWEAAYAKDYRIEVAATSSKNNNNNWQVVFDGTDPQKQSQERRSSEERGKSPGVSDDKTPLHVIHTISFPQASEAGVVESSSSPPPPFRYLRITILKSGRGWGVSLWKVDVFGNYVVATDKR